MAGSDAIASTAPAERAEFGIPPLENGAHLSAREFLRRYESMPEIKKAELIDGKVYLGSSVSFAHHGSQDALVQTWLGYYAIATPGVKHAVNSTTRLGPDDVPQPDGLLRILPECGGQARIDAKGYLQGAPELVVEIAASSVSMDVRDKRDSYRRSGVKEYFVWRTQDGAIDWWFLDEDEFQPLPAAADGTVRSRAFPGLWARLDDMLAGRGPQVLATLQAGLADPAHAEFVTMLQSRRGSAPPATPG